MSVENIVIGAEPAPRDSFDSFTTIPEVFIENPLSPAEKCLLDAILLPEDQNDALHAEFNAAVQKELETCIDPFDTDAILTEASKIEWLYFARPGDKLPERLAITHAGNIVAIDPKFHEVSIDVNEYLRHYVLAEVEERMSELSSDNSYALEDAFYEIIKESAIFRYLKALTCEAPRSGELPLTEQQKRLRVIEEEAAVRLANGLSYHDSLSNYPVAQRQLRRRIYQIDDETTIRNTSDTHDSIQRVLKHFTDVYNSMKPETEPEISGLYVDDNGIKGRSTNPDKVDPALSDFFIDLSYDLAESLSPRDIYAEFTESKLLLKRFIDNLLDHTDSGSSAEELLHLTAYNCVDISNFESDLARLKPHLMRTEADVIIPSLSFYGIWRKSSPEEYIDVVPYDVLKRGLNTLMGAASGDLHSAANHLMITVNSTREYPKIIDNYDLKIVTNDSVRKLQYLPNDTDTVPVLYVPGFYLVAHNNTDSKETYFFKRSEQDPYSGSVEVEIPLEQKEEIIALCNQIGFTYAAKSLMRAGKMSLADLVEAIRDSSDYTFDKSNVAYSVKRDIYKPDTFSRLINERGRLQVQCTGAVILLKHILKTAFPESSSSIIGGYVIESDGQIAQAGHVQLLITINGLQYVLDSTPPLHQISGGVNTKLFRKLSRQEQKTQAPIEQPVVSAANDLIVDYEKKDKAEVISTNKEQLNIKKSDRAKNVPTIARQVLKAYFKITFGSDNEIYTRIVKLRKDADPLRRALQVILRHEYGEDVQSEIDKEVEYLQNLSQADSTIFNTIRIPHYDSSLLLSFKQMLEDLRSA